LHPTYNGHVGVSTMKNWWG